MEQQLHWRALLICSMVVEEKSWEEIEQVVLSLNTIQEEYNELDTGRIALREKLNKTRSKLVLENSKQRSNSKHD